MPNLLLVLATLPNQDLELIQIPPWGREFFPKHLRYLQRNVFSARNFSLSSLQLQMVEEGQDGKELDQLRKLGTGSS